LPPAGLFGRQLFIDAFYPVEQIIQALYFPGNDIKLAPRENKRQRKKEKKHSPRGLYLFHGKIVSGGIRGGKTVYP
jgi:hypothetical protein